MKNMRTMLMMVMLILVGMASADNLTIEKAAVSAGGTRLIAIELKNTNKQYEAFQFDLVLPGGISIAKNEKGKLDANLNEERKVDHSLTVLSQKDNSFRFMSYSMGDNAFKGTSGVLVYVMLEAKDGLSLGSKDAAIKSQVFTDITGEVSKWDDTAFKITVVEPSTVTAKSYERVYGEANPKFEYEVSGGALDGKPEITCKATEKSPVGTYDIIVKKGTETDNSVTYVKGTLTITKAPLKIKAWTYTRKQGEENPEFTLTYEGLKNDETEDVLTKKPTVTTTATEESAVGDYPVTVSDAEADNYDISYTNGTLKVTDADAVIVTAKDYTRVYGEDNPAFEYTSSGAELVGIPEITCEATASSPVGTYDIVISKGSVTNYNDTYVKGTLTITKAPLKIKAGTYTRKQGEENPEFTLSYEGFKNDETEDVLTKKPTVTTTATVESDLGDYPVTVSGAEADNYDISYTNGTLKVTDADAVIVTAKNYTRVYGEDNPTFEYTSSGAELIGIPEITCEATASSPVGTYNIVISKGSVTNYNDTYVKGTLTITKAPLKIKAGTYTKKRGKDNPEFTLTYEGFKNEETKDALIKQPITTTAATKESAVGEYEVKVSGAEAQNYDISYQNGILTVTINLGDANVDGDVTEADVKAVAKHIMGQTPTGFDEEAADVNGDKTINAADIVEIVKMKK